MWNTNRILTKKSNASLALICGRYTKTKIIRRLLFHWYFKKLRKKANKLRAKKNNPKLVWYIIWMIKHKLSPEQIAGRIKKFRPDDDTWHIANETIYQIIYDLVLEKGYDLALL